ncbi:MAG: MotA/TolQ/ExbB proton channel family protein [Maricaulis sp.]|uniref:MotA/TolQ/ExbB proton channel family protein n=1 Tax=Maricaulis sp. TaxID=1486257 RepID=UPI00260E20C2|nr:MotA/TolQ/ExbB proton channel family protein [Maricaulis sp.]MDM7984787.1 MotA/TolQ/ExbB proton channel family protein [Maricaulis sp.]
MDFQAVYSGLQEFLERGGPVLVVIMITSFIMWAFMLERFAYFFFAQKGDADRALREWAARADKQSWYAHAIRDQLISEVKASADQNVELIKTLVAVAPLFGLLGTVTGMVSVFDVMSISGSSDAQAMSAGVSRATIPTMAGMVASLSGLILANYIERMAKRRTAVLASDLEIEEG